MIWCHSLSGKSPSTNSHVNVALTTWEISYFLYLCTFLNICENICLYNDLLKIRMSGRKWLITCGFEFDFASLGDVFIL